MRWMSTRTGRSRRQRFLPTHPRQLRKLDKNGRWQADAGRSGALQMQMGRGGGGPGGRRRPPGDAAKVKAEEMNRHLRRPLPGNSPQTLMMFDSNQRMESWKRVKCPKRMQGMFEERGDTNHDGVLTRDGIHGNGGSESPAGEWRRRRPRAGQPWRTGWAWRTGPVRCHSNALDTNHDGEISSDEINNAATSLKTTR